MKFPLRDWITGFVLERCSRAFEPKPIVAYLYNGVRLPALPEWDREAYRDAFMYFKDATGVGSLPDRYYLIASEPIEIRRVANTNTVCAVSNNGLGALKMTQWVCYSPYEGWELIFEGEGVGSHTMEDIVWSKNDIPYADDYTDTALAGTCAVEGSNPMPVYE